MDTDSDEWSARFPRLFAQTYVDYAAARTSYASCVPPEHLVSRLHLVAVTGVALIVVCRSAEGWRFLPGGTREPGESLQDLAARELLEEAGATLRGDPIHFSAHQVDSERTAPYRPHLPHPRAFWAYAGARVEITSVPSNPPNGEEVVEVLTLPAVAAAAYLDRENPVHADVVRHAAAMGLLEQMDHPHS